ncbi:hypothetical protein QTP70_014283 [Hemibagrus guttatus]|uniref:ribonuclease H n=1 Tax=Hemibagrus guttatus TaxID=175788 RepID=A0AAE0QG88_9TELE|nr:hypothetical protein QTP70_014283 [Hemibagrus guttatus]
MAVVVNPGLDQSVADNTYKLSQTTQYFHTTHGHYEYYGLTNAPAVFQALINGVFQDLLGKGVIAYIDDILVYSVSMEDHVRQVREVFARLQRHHLYVKLEKCEFHRAMVTFLGYVISRQGVEMDVGKVWTVTEWPAPATVRELQRFLGFANFYRRFIQNYSGYALEEWRHWLEGVRQPFQVLTDHRNLEYLRGAKRLNPRQARWALFFTSFQFTVSYRPGSKNGKADALSRQFEAANESGQPDLIRPATAVLEPVQWDLVEEIRRSYADEPPPASCPPHKLFVPQQIRSQVMQWVHEASSSGHPETQRPADRLSSSAAGSGGPPWAWQCSICAQARTSRQHPEGLLVPLPVPRRPWSHLSVDFLTDLPDSGGFMAVMVVVDRFSKGCKLVPLKGLPTAMQTVEAMFSHVFQNFGLPEDIVSDRGPQFTSRVWGSLCARLDIGVSVSSIHHPQSNGQAERLNQEIRRFLRTYCSREQQRWSEFLPWVEYAQNSLTHSSTGLTLFQCMLGYRPPLFPWSGEPSNVPAVEEWYRLSLEVWERAHVRLQRAVRRQRIQADRHCRPHPSYQVGQRVWLSTRNLCLKLPCRKLSPKFIGLFKIICQVNPVAYRLRLPASYCICPTFHVSLLKPAHSSAGEPVAGEDPPPPLELRGCLHTRCGLFWTPDAYGHVCSTSWTGRGMVPRNGHTPGKKAYDRVPREELWYCMKKSGVAEKYVRVVQDMYERSRTVVRCAIGQTEDFKVEVGLQQGSALSPFLFALVMDQLSEECDSEVCTTTFQWLQPEQLSAKEVTKHVAKDRFLQALLSKEHKAMTPAPRKSSLKG